MKKIKEAMNYMRRTQMESKQEYQKRQNDEQMYELVISDDESVNDEKPKS